MNWKINEVGYLAKHYPNTPTKELATILHKSERVIIQKASQMGVRKQPRTKTKESPLIEKMKQIGFLDALILEGKYTKAQMLEKMKKRGFEVSERGLERLIEAFRTDMQAPVIAATVGGLTVYKYQNDYKLLDYIIHKILYP